MQVRDKIRTVSTSRANSNNLHNLPTLRNSTLPSKATIALSKVDIDSRHILKEKAHQLNPNLERDREYQRSLSGFSVRKSREQLNEATTFIKTQLQFHNPSQFKMSLKDAKEQEKTGVSNQLIVDKAKVSSKSYGIVKAYSANSHPGPLLSFNEDRVCIVTNLTKTNIKQKQVSFFAVYDGNNGVSRADYMRDNFHLTLACDESFPNDMQSALRSTLRKIGRAFSEDPRFHGDESFVSFAIIVTLNEEVHYLQSGSCKGVFSSNLGENIFFPTKSENILGVKQPTKKSKTVGELMKKIKGNLTEVQYRKLVPSDGLDFVLLGSEGVFENMKIPDIGKKIWLYLLKNMEESIHFAVGEANNQLLSDVFLLMGSKNTSLVIIAFESITQCLQGVDLKEAIVLPYMPKNGQ